MADLTLNPLGFVLAATFLGLMLILFRWMFAVLPPPPMQVLHVERTVYNLDRILVPLQESVASERAVELACRLASTRESEIVLANVIVVPLSLRLDTQLPNMEADAERAQDIGEFIIKQHKLQCVRRTVRNRTVTDGILQLAREVEADVIVLGTGIPQRRNFVELSQTAAELLRRAPCEVIVDKARMPA